MSTEKGQTPTRDEAFSQMRYVQHQQNIAHDYQGPTGKICPWCKGGYENSINTLSISTDGGL